MFEISIEQTFAAGHALRNYRGKCENVHGHNYRVQRHSGRRGARRHRPARDFVEMKRVIRAIIERFDHQFLNDVPPFDKLNPSAENMARYFHEELARALDGGARLNPIRVAEVKIWETDTATATYRLP